MQYLLDNGRGLGWQGIGTDVFTWRPGRLDPHRLDREAACLAQVADFVAAAANGSHN